MLLLFRKRQQRTTITVPPSTEATVIEVIPVDRSGRLGFEAPKEVTILRREVQERIARSEA